MPFRQHGAYVSQLLHTDPTSAGHVLDSVYRGLTPDRSRAAFRAAGRPSSGSPATACG